VIRLSKTASEEELVLFFSSQTGLLPSQSELLRRIAQKTGCATDAELEQLNGLSAQDQARHVLIASALSAGTIAHRMSCAMAMIRFLISSVMV